MKINKLVTYNLIAVVAITWFLFAVFGVTVAWIWVGFQIPFDILFVICVKMLGQFANIVPKSLQSMMCSDIKNMKLFIAQKLVEVISCVLVVFFLGRIAV